MSSLTWDERKARDASHADDPQPGDYWSDHLRPVAVILGRVGKQIFLCRTTKDVDVNHWTWDLDKSELMPAAKFREWIAYRSIPGYWATVSPRSHMWAVKEATGCTADTSGAALSSVVDKSTGFDNQDGQSTEVQP